MSNIAVIAKITAQPGKRADVVAGMASMIDHVETEAGTVEVHVTEDQAEEDVLWVYEEYTDQAALDSPRRQRCDEGARRLDRPVPRRSAGTVLHLRRRWQGHLNVPGLTVRRRRTER